MSPREHLLFFRQGDTLIPRNDMPLKISKRENGDVVIVDISGRLVYGDDTSLLRSEVKEIFEDGGPQVVLNLSDVPYVDSGGIGTLVGLYTSAKNAGGDLKLACPSERVNHALEITKLIPVIGVYSDESDALAALREAKPGNA